MSRLAGEERRGLVFGTFVSHYNDLWTLKQWLARWRADGYEIQSMCWWDSVHFWVVLRRVA